MKIAVCFSGQWRTGNYCYDNLKRFFGLLYPYCDFFIHTWDINKQKCYNLSNVFSKETKLTDDDINELKSKYNPKKIIIEDYNHIHNTLQTYEKTAYKDVKVFDIIQPLWYSFYKSVELKKEYEKENKFEYDYVIKLRPDIIFKPNRRLVQDIELYFDEINSGEFYIENLMREWTVDNTTIDDVYFLSKSKQMNIAAEYHNHWLEWGILSDTFYGFLRHAHLNNLKISNYKKRYLGGDPFYSVMRPECLKYGTTTEEEFDNVVVCENYYYGDPNSNSKSPKGFYIHLLKNLCNIDDTTEYYVDELDINQNKKII
jgi:hypothetical protein